eukprot:2926159-Rhodomonas_salina.1
MSQRERKTPDDLGQRVHARVSVCVHGSGPASARACVSLCARFELVDHECGVSELISHPPVHDPLHLRPPLNGSRQVGVLLPPISAPKYLCSPDHVTYGLGHVPSCLGHVTDMPLGHVTQAALALATASRHACGARSRLTQRKVTSRLCSSITSH